MSPMSPNAFPCETTYFLAPQVQNIHINTTPPKRQDPPLLPNLRQPPRPEVPLQEFHSKKWHLFTGRGSRFVSGIRQAPKVQIARTQFAKEINAGRRITGTGSGTHFSICMGQQGTSQDRCQRRGGLCILSPPLRAVTGHRIPAISFVGLSRQKWTNMNEGLFRWGMKSIPQNATNLGDEMDGDLYPRLSGTGKRRTCSLCLCISGMWSWTQEKTFNQCVLFLHPTHQWLLTLAPDIVLSSLMSSDLVDSSQPQMRYLTPADPNSWPGTNPGSPTLSQC
jgi:hypothetical protein